MNNLTETLISLIIIAGISGGLVASVAFGPSIFADRKTWLQRSFLSSYLFIIGLFPLFLTWTLSDLQDFEFKTILKSVLLLLIYCLIGGAFLAMLVYTRILLLERFSKNLRAAKK